MPSTRPSLARLTIQVCTAADSLQKRFKRMQFATVFSAFLSCRFLWGPAARAEHKAASEADEAVQPSARCAFQKASPCVSAGINSYHNPRHTLCKLSDTARTWECVFRCRAAIIKDTAVLDARRSALSVIHFPEQCSLLPAGDQPLEALSSSNLPACSAAGYDPAFLVPFTLQVREAPTLHFHAVTSPSTSF